MSEKAGLVAEITAASVANKMTWAGGTAGFFGWLAQINWIGLAGVFVAVVGLLANIYFQRRRDQRETAESAARIAMMNAGIQPRPAPEAERERA